MDYHRYQRHFPVIGIKGQEQLNNASVCIIGCGGVGSPISMYLAASGVGRIGLVDFDVVELSNLQRQIIYTEDDINKPKVVAAKKHLSQLNSTIQIDTYNQKLDYTFATKLLKSYDLIIDGTDNFETRYVINDACTQLEKPFISVSVLKDKAQIAFFNAKDVCYRCIYPHKPPINQIPNCAEAGVLGVSVGVVGTMAAQLTLNHILKSSHDRSYQQKLMVFDSNTLQWHHYQISPNKECISCQKKKLNPIEHKKPKTDIKEIDYLIDNALIIDVREPWEITIAPLPVKHMTIPLAQILTDQSTFESLKEYRNQPIIFICKAGIRSKVAAQHFKSQKFNDIYNFSGGIDFYYKNHLGINVCY